MRVKVSESFGGLFGVYDRSQSCVVKKGPEDEPFEVAAEDGDRLISKGVLVPAPQESGKKKPRKDRKNRDASTEDGLL